MKYYDFHSHIIPGVDDGAREPEISARMLELLGSQGVECAALTPHCYLAEETIDEFCRRRGEGLERLKSVYKPDAMPEFIVGAEVALLPGISRQELSKACFYGDYILLEMPVTFGTWVTDEIEKIMLKGLRPVFAHIERPFMGYRKNDFDKLIDYRSFIYQINVEALSDRGIRKYFLRQLREGARFILGSDCHNLTGRPPDFDGKALTSRALNQGFMQSVLYNSEFILDKVGET